MEQQSSGQESMTFTMGKQQGRAITQQTRATAFVRLFFLKGTGDQCLSLISLSLG